MLGHFLTGAPLIVAGLVLFIAMVLAREVGAQAKQIAACRHKAKLDTNGDANVLLSVALGLLSLLIGFSFSLSLSRFDHRRELVVSEASALSTAVQRIQLLDSPARDDLTSQLRNYAAARALAGTTDNDEKRHRLESRAENLSIPLLRATIAAVTPRRETPTASFVLDGIDHAVEAKLPTRIIEALAIYCVVVAGLFGYALSTTSSKNRVATYLVFSLFAFAVATILDLDRPLGGSITIGQQPIMTVLQRLTPQPPAPGP
jgi:hypothetical protein